MVVLGDRLERYTQDVRVVDVQDVNPDAGFGVVKDPRGGVMRVGLDYLPVGLIRFPQAGEKWLIDRRSNRWAFVTRLTPREELEGKSGTDFVPFTVQTLQELIDSELLNFPGGGGGGTDGREIELSASATHIQWRYVGSATWTNLVALEDLRGPQGDPGSPGDPGSNVELGTSSTHIQWRTVGSSTWNDLVALEDLRGPQGDPGEPGPPGGGSSSVLEPVDYMIQVIPSSSAPANMFPGDDLAAWEAADGPEIYDVSSGRIFVIDTIDPRNSGIYDYVEGVSFTRAPDADTTAKLHNKLLVLISASQHERIYHFSADNPSGSIGSVYWSTPYYIASTEREALEVARPRGVVQDHVYSGPDQTGITSLTLTASAVTFSAEAGRKYRVSTSITVRQVASAGTVHISLYGTGSPTGLGRVGSFRSNGLTDNTDRATISGWSTLSWPTDGDYTVGLALETTGGSCQVLSTSGSPTRILVEDIGVA